MWRHKNSPMLSGPPLPSGPCGGGVVARPAVDASTGGSSSHTTPHCIERVRRRRATATSTLIDSAGAPEVASALALAAAASPGEAMGGPAACSVPGIKGKVEEQYDHSAIGKADYGDAWLLSPTKTSRFERVQCPQPSSFSYPIPLSPSSPSPAGRPISPAEAPSLDPTAAGGRSAAAAVGTRAVNVRALEDASVAAMERVAEAGRGGSAGVALSASGSGAVTQAGAGLRWSRLRRGSRNEAAASGGVRFAMLPNK